MAKQQPHTLWFTHADGRWIEVVLETFQQLYVPSEPDDHPGGLYLGSDPTCDVVLDGDDVRADTELASLYPGDSTAAASRSAAGSSRNRHTSTRRPAIRRSGRPWRSRTTPASKGAPPRRPRSSRRSGSCAA
jgi:hypothetical protein